MNLLLGENGVILHLSQTIGYQENGNILVDNGTLAYAPMLVDAVISVGEIPENITPMRWRYINGEFIKNTNWKEPQPEYDETDQILDIIEGKVVINA